MTTARFRFPCRRPRSTPPPSPAASRPRQPHFYAEYGPDYEERYQWRFPPTTGAYEVLPEDIVKGASITQTRVKNWWAKDRKYYRYRFNPDKIVNTVVRDESKAFELFRAGELDTFYLTRPDLWYEKSEIDPVYKGYIERVTFYNRYPKIPRGLYLNVIKPPLDNRDVRIGIALRDELAEGHRRDVPRRLPAAQRLQRGLRRVQRSLDQGAALIPSISAREAFARRRLHAARAATASSRNPTAPAFPSPSPIRACRMYDRMFAILREEAKACGFELRLDGLEATVAYKKEMQKQHEMTFQSWLIQPPVPDFHQFLHSSQRLRRQGQPQAANQQHLFLGPRRTPTCSATRSAPAAPSRRSGTPRGNSSTSCTTRRSSSRPTRWITSASARGAGCAGRIARTPVSARPSSMTPTRSSCSGSTRRSRRKPTPPAAPARSFPESTTSRGCLSRSSREPAPDTARRPATHRRPRSTMTGAPENILEVDKLITSFETDRGLLRAVDQVSFSVPDGQDRRHRRRVRLRQKRHRHVDRPAAAATGRQDPRRPRAFQGPRPAPRQRRGNPQGPRRRDRRDFPGADVRAQPGPPHRPPGRRGLPPAPEDLEKGRLGRRHRDARTRPHPRSGKAHDGLSAPAFRRHAPAHRHRPRPRLPARRSSSPTNRPPRSTSPSRRRSST